MHVVLNYMAVRVLRMEILNNARLLLCLKEYLKSQTVGPMKKVNISESIIWGLGITGINDNALLVCQIVQICFYDFSFTSTILCTDFA